MLCRLQQPPFWQVAEVRHRLVVSAITHAARNSLYDKVLRRRHKGASLARGLQPFLMGKREQELKEVSYYVELEKSAPDTFAGTIE